VKKKMGRINGRETPKKPKLPIRFWKSNCKKNAKQMKNIEGKNMHSNAFACVFAPPDMNISLGLDCPNRRLFV